MPELTESDWSDIKSSFQKYSNARTIIPVEPGSELLREVMSLGRPNAKTLGYFPDGALWYVTASRERPSTKCVTATSPV